MGDHYTITLHLTTLETKACIKLGGALGLLQHSLKKMDDMPGDMVAAWLRQEGNVINTTGAPTWNILAAKLDEIEQGGIAQNIRTIYGLPQPKASGIFTVLLPMCVFIYVRMEKLYGVSNKVNTLLYYVSANRYHTYQTNDYTYMYL